MAIPDQTYDITSGTASTLSSLGWTQTLSSLCPAIAYTLTNQNGSALDAIFSCTSSITVNTADINKLAIYYLTVTGDVGVYTSA